MKNKHEFRISNKKTTVITTQKFNAEQQRSSMQIAEKIINEPKKQTKKMNLRIYNYFKDTMNV